MVSNFIRCRTNRRINVQKCLPNENLNLHNEPIQENSWIQIIFIAKFSVYK